MCPCRSKSEFSSDLIGFGGSAGLNIPIYADEELRGLRNYVTGANEAEAHLVKVNWTDIEQEITRGRIRFAMAGDVCEASSASFDEKRGMEMDHIFKLPHAISEPLNATYTDEEGNDKPIVMGCREIEVSRILSAVAEVSSDENGAEIVPASAVVTNLEHRTATPRQGA